MSMEGEASDGSNSLSEEGIVVADHAHSLTIRAEHFNELLVTPTRNDGCIIVHGEGAHFGIAVGRDARRIRVRFNGQRQRRKTRHGRKGSGGRNRRNRSSRR